MLLLRISFHRSFLIRKATVMNAKASNNYIAMSHFPSDLPTSLQTVASRHPRRASFPN